MKPVPIRPATTIIVLRDFPHAPQVLMGQRGSAAVFMPNKFVFPGGAVDADDANVPLHAPLPPQAQDQLRDDGHDITPATLAAAAIRELWEETGLILGTKSDWATDLPDWAGFAATGHRPCAQHLHFFFRAITPPGPPRRFDARFFVVDARHIANDLDDFSQACEELSHLQWVPLDKTRSLNLPFITEIVLGELCAMDHIGPLSSVPFFQNGDEESLFKRLRGNVVYQG